MGVDEGNLLVMGVERYILTCSSYGVAIFERKNPRSCDCTETRTHVPTSEGFEVTNWTTGATGFDEGNLLIILLLLLQS